MIRIKQWWMDKEVRILKGPKYRRGVTPEQAGGWIKRLLAPWKK